MRLTYQYPQSAVHKIFFVVIVLFFCTKDGFAQRKKKALFKNDKTALLIGIGTAIYYGDLCSEFACMSLSPALGIGFNYRLSNHLSSKTELNLYTLAVKDIYPVRNLDFRSTNLEFYTAAVYDFFPYKKNFTKRKLLMPYGFIGIGLSYFHTKGKDPLTGEWIALGRLATEGTKYIPITAILPFGGGLKVKVSKAIEVMVEAAYRVTFTDHMDDVSAASYTNLDNFTDPLARRMSMRAPFNTDDPNSYANTYKSQIRGNPKSKDGYLLVSFKIKYTPGANRYSGKGKHPMLQPQGK